MTTFVQDTFTEASTTNLASHTGEVGASWTQHAASTVSFPPSTLTVSSSFDNLYNNGNAGNTFIFYASGVPGSADYSVSCDILTTSAPTAVHYVGILGRLDTSTLTAYHFRFNGAASAFQLYRIDAGSFTLLDSVSGSISGTAQNMRLEMVGGEIKGYLDDVEVVSYTDPTPISSAGRAGIRWAWSNVDGEPYVRLDNFIAASTAASPPGGATTISNVTNTSDSLTVTYSYDAADETGYEYRLNGGTATTLGSSPATISGLSSSTVYDVQVRAINASGSGAWSAAWLTATEPFETETLQISNAFPGALNRQSFYVGGRVFISALQGTVTKAFQLAGSTWTSFDLKDFGSNDTHNAAAFLPLASGKLAAFYVNHNVSTSIFYRISASDNAIDFGSEQSVSNGSDAVAYPCPIQTGDGRVWVFFTSSDDSGNTRDVAYIYSDDDCATWSSPVILYQASSGARSYFTAVAIGNDVYVTNTLDNPADVASGSNHLYFSRWNSTASEWQEADGTAYTLPITAATAEVAFNASAASLNASVPTDIVLDGSDIYIYHPARTQSIGTGYPAVTKWNGTAWATVNMMGSLSTANYYNYAVKAAGLYDVYAVVDDGSGESQIYRLTSNDTGATVTPTQLTDGAVTGNRWFMYKIRGDALDIPLIYFRGTQPTTTSFSGDIYTMFDALPGGGTPTLSSPGAINVLSDRATPQVTLTF